MKLTDLKNELDNLLYRHPLTETNVDSVSMDGTDIRLETDVSYLRNELDDANSSLAAYEKSEKELEEKLDAAETERDELRELVADIKDPESGRTLKDFMDEAKEANERAKRHIAIAKAAHDECMALRKRKGVEPELFANGREIIELIREIAYDKRFETAGPCRRAEELASKLSGAVYTLPPYIRGGI